MKGPRKPARSTIMERPLALSIASRAGPVSAITFWLTPERVILWCRVKLPIGARLRARLKLAGGRALGLHLIPLRALDRVRVRGQVGALFECSFEASAPQQRAALRRMIPQLNPDYEVAWAPPAVAAEPAPEPPQEAAPTWPEATTLGGATPGLEIASADGGAARRCLRRVDSDVYVKVQPLPSLKLHRSWPLIMHLPGGKPVGVHGFAHAHEAEYTELRVPGTEATQLRRLLRRLEES